MTDLVPTRLTHLLLKKALLRHRLDQIGVPAKHAFPALSNGGRNVKSLDADTLDRLQRQGLVEARADTTSCRGRLSLCKVQAINLELTYGCNMTCNHCLQQSMRSGWSGIELDVEVAKGAIREAQFAGLCETGLNLTGGEALLRGDVVFALVAFASSLGIKVRLNSNSWWGIRSDFMVGGRKFPSPAHLVRHLKQLGLTMFAFSFDSRFEQMPSAFDGLVGSVSACEQEEMDYQVVCTGQEREQFRIGATLAARTGRPLEHLSLVPMQMLDIGGAAGAFTQARGARQDLATLALQSDCRGKGFYHPTLLHIDPSGGVRSCLYAPGLRNLGNLNESSLIGIINRFPDNSVSLAFSQHEIRRVSEEIFLPEIWKTISHPCTASVVIARLVDAASCVAAAKGHPPDRGRLIQINRSIAQELNLAHQPSILR